MALSQFSFNYPRSVLALPSGVIAACVCLFVRQSWACSVQASFTKFGPDGNNTYSRIEMHFSIFKVGFGFYWPWYSISFDISKHIVLTNCLIVSLAPKSNINVRFVQQRKHKDHFWLSQLYHRTVFCSSDLISHFYLQYVYNSVPHTDLGSRVYFGI